jgi:hypothetical protein
MPHCLFTFLLIQRLDLGHQLIDTPKREWQTGESQEIGQSWGIPLPHDVQVSELSLLVEPSSSSADDKTSPRKAVLALYSTDAQAAEFDYWIVCLQLSRQRAKKKNSTNDSGEKQPYFVMAHQALNGRLRNGARSVGPVSSVFLAGSTFRFDLRKLQKKSKPMVDFYVTLGVIRSPGGLEGVGIGRDGNTRITSVTEKELSKFWLSDVIHSNSLLGTAGPPIAEFSWILKLLNGDLACWVVPSLMPKLDGQLDERKGFIWKESEQPKGLRPLNLVCTHDKTPEEKRWLLGTSSFLGKASDWIQQASSDTQSMVTMLHVPGSKFGCILQAGSDSLVFGGSKRDCLDSNFTEKERKPTFLQSSFLMTPPTFVMSLYLLLLEVAYLQMEIRDIKCLSNANDTPPECETRLQVSRLLFTL